VSLGYRFAGKKVALANFLSFSELKRFDYQLFISINQGNHEIARRQVFPSKILKVQFDAEQDIPELSVRS
jgi:hypothetical protein